MREILFRGKKYKTSVFDKTDWIYGSLIDSGNHEQVTIYPWYDGASTMSVRQLVYARMEAVKPETVGQFTGMTDKNDTKIFEGDIVRDASGVIYPVVWSLTGFYLKYSPPHAHGFHYDLLPLSNYWHAHGAIIEIIGNIHDNPELLEDCK